MIPAPSFDHIDKILNQETFEVDHRISMGLPLTTKTVGFIIFDQDYCRGPIRDLIQNLDMLNLKSGNDMHFFLCGVSKYGKSEKGAKKLGEIDGVRLYHNARASYSFIEAFKREISGWSYSMGLDILLIDVVENDNRRTLNFSTAVCFKIEELITRKIIERPSELLDKLVNFVQEGKVVNATQFRDELRSKFGINWLKELILAMFPKHVGKIVRAEVILFGGAATRD